MIGLKSLITVTVAALACVADARAKSARSQTHLEARATSKFSPGTGYTAAWSTTGNRIKIGAKAVAWISESTLSGSSVTQYSVDTCTNKCSNTKSCVTAYVIQFSGGTGSNVVCDLYSEAKTSADATYTTRLDKTGKVVASYAFVKTSALSSTTTTTVKPTTTSKSTATSSSTKASSTSTSKPTTTSKTTTSSSKTTTSSSKMSTSVTRASSTTTSAATNKSTTNTSSSTTAKVTATTTAATTTKATSTTTATTTSTKTTTSVQPTPTVQAGISTDGPQAPNNFPAPPSGATLYQFSPSKCVSTSGYVPIFANRHWVNSTKTTSTARRAYVLQHGAGRDFDDAFRALSPNVDSESLIVALNFYLPSDAPTVTNGVQSNWFVPTYNLAWDSTNAWTGGGDAVAPAARKGVCSTYDVWDSMVEKLNDKTAFPNLDVIYLMGHSAGGSFVNHYATVAQFSSSLPIKWAGYNPAVLPYFESHRPNSSSACSSSYQTWPYGLNSAPRYVAASGVSDAQSLFKKWLQLDFSHAVGTLDIRRLYDFGDDSCEVQAQGGHNRRDRNYAWWAYINILGGTGTDVSAFYGADTLMSNVTAWGNNGFNHRNCVIAGVGHVDDDMYASPCGQYFLGQTIIPPPDTAPATPA
ncbi:unnamed protein product [Jaminaea pallidilutea]